MSFGFRNKYFIFGPKGQRCFGQIQSKVYNPSQWYPTDSHSSSTSKHDLFDRQFRRGGKLCWCSLRQIEKKLIRTNDKNVLAFLCSRIWSYKSILHDSFVRSSDVSFVLIKSGKRTTLPPLDQWERNAFGALMMTSSCLLTVMPNNRVGSLPIRRHKYSGETCVFYFFVMTFATHLTPRWWMIFVRWLSNRWWGKIHREYGTIVHPATVSQYDVVVLEKVP